MVDDPLPLLAYLLACEAASTCQRKFQVGDVIDKVTDDAYLICDELFGLRRCPPQPRPTDDQLAELVQEVAKARSGNALGCVAFVETASLKWAHLVRHRVRVSPPDVKFGGCLPIPSNARTTSVARNK